LCATNLNFRKKNKLRKEYIDKEVKGKIWNKSLDFSNGCGAEHWVDANLYFPIISCMYNVNVVWFGVNIEKTVFVIRKGNKKGKTFQYSTRKGYVDPDVLLKKSIVKDSIVMLFYNNHYQFVQLK